MVHTILLLIHISGATVGLLSGFAAMFLRKGSSWHAAAGTVFVVSMLAMSSTAAYMAAFLKPVPINMIVGLLTMYLVSTAWWAAKRRNEKTGLFDAGALLYVAIVAVSAFVYGVQEANSPDPPKGGVPAPAYFIFGTVAVICTVTDIRLLRRGSITGRARMVRHLWRMAGALLIATLSFYPGQAKLFPKDMRTPLLFVPHILLIGSMLFWRWRYRVRRRDSLERRALSPSPVPG